MANKAAYERNAEACIRLAEKSQDASERAQLLAMAQAWRKLASQVERVRALRDKAKKLPP